MGDKFDSGHGSDGESPGHSMTKKPQGKRFKETTKRLRHGKENHLSHRASLDWRHDQRRVCEETRDDATPTPAQELKDILVQSRTARALFESAAAKDLEIFYDAQNMGGQSYSSTADRAAIITLNPFRTRGDLLNMLVRELRRLWQHGQGALVNPLSFDPDDAILLNRAQLADAFMVSVRVAWELKLGGHQDAWNYLAGSPMADIGRAFEVKAQSDFRTLNNGAAARAAYDKFFEDSRTKIHDKRLIHQMLLDENGYMRRPPDPTPSPAPKAASKRRSSGISIDLFKKLGELPEGRNYLSLKGGKSPTDFCYAAVEDRSNANFLWFIKFERSFHEKELQMVNESVRLSAEIVDFAKWATRGAGGQDSSSTL